MTELPPLKMERLLVEKAWGGRRLGEILGIDLAPGRKIGESWELADHDHGTTSTAAPHRWSLRRWMEEEGPRILGRARAGEGGRFPLLVKYIHSLEPLSVQVHPDDAYAHRLCGGVGKSEAWYILEALPGAWVIAGLRPGVSREQFQRDAATERVADLLQRHEVRAGDSIFIPARTVHAIGPGIVLAEVQQNSDITYRLFDWGRTNREIHVADGLAVASLEPCKGVRRGEDLTSAASCELVRCDRFAMSLHRGPLRELALEGIPRVLMCLGAGGVLRTADAEPLELAFGDTVLVPACTASARIEAAEQALFLLAEPTQLQ